MTTLYRTMESRIRCRAVWAWGVLERMHWCGTVAARAASHPCLFLMVSFFLLFVSDGSYLSSFPSGSGCFTAKLAVYCSLACLFFFSACILGVGRAHGGFALVCVRACLLMSCFCVVGESWDVGMKEGVGRLVDY